MVTLNDLIKATVNFKPDLFVGASTVRAREIKYEEFEDIKIYTAVTTDVGSKKQDERKVTIAFKGTVDLNSPVDVCSDSPYYLYTFWLNNYIQECHFGSFTAQVRKNSGTSTNPLDSIGLDKHLIALIKYLVNNLVISIPEKYEYKKYLL